MTGTEQAQRPHPGVSRLDRLAGAPSAAFRHALDRDARGVPPRVPAGLDLALRLSYVPRSAGGDLRALDETLLLAMVAARRDATLMPATMFSVTAVTAVLIGGSTEQRDDVVGLLRRGGAIGLAVSEPDTDTDTLGGACRLDLGSWVLAGNKWRAGVAGERPWLLVVGRTGERGPGAFTAVLLDGDRTHTALTGAEDTDGFRGVRFARARFDGLPVGEEAVVGGPGRGLELTLRAMQLVRVLSNAAALGSADTALRTALDQHAGAERRRAHLLGVAAAALFAGQISALTTARAVHVVPDCQAVWSSTAKWVGAELSESVHRHVSDALGFRAALRTPATLAGRDNRMVRYIDTDPVANSELLIQQLGRLGRRPDSPPADLDRLRPVFDLGAGLPEFDPAGLVLNAAELSPPLAALPAIVAARPAEPPLTEELDRLVRAAEGLRADLHASFADPGTLRDTLTELVERFVWLHAAAEAVCLWWANPGRELFGTPAGSADWLWPVLSLLRDLAEGGRGRLCPAAAAAALDIAGRLHGAGMLFAPPEVPLTEADRTGGEDR